jgi:chromate reductase
MITIVVGTNRRDSKSQKIALQYQQILSEKNIECEILSLQKLPHDYINSALYENVGKNEEFNEIRVLMNKSSKFVFVIPEYNGSFPGVLKAFIDGLDRSKALTNKKCALIGISAGDQGAGLALSHITDILNYCGTHVLAYKLRLPNIGNYMTDDKISHKSYLDKIEKQAQMLIDF